MFWGDLLFCLNESSVWVESEHFTIEIANNGSQFLNLELCEMQVPNCDVQIKPMGQLQIQTIYDRKLILVNQNKQIFRIDLEHPLILFLLHLQF